MLREFRRRWGDEAINGCAAVLCFHILLLLLRSCGGKCRVGARSDKLNILSMWFVIAYGLKLNTSQTNIGDIVGDHA